MSFEVFRNDGSVSLNDRENCLRLVQEGSVTGTAFGQDFETASTMYEYKITVPRPIDDNVFLLFIKSDFDKITRHRNVEFTQNEANVYFLSTANIVKEYKYFAPFSFGSFSTETDFGATIFDENGVLIYDTRVPECKIKDTFPVGDATQTVSHAAVGTAWYSLNLFPVDFSVVPSGQPSNNIIILKSFQQLSSTSLEINVSAFLIATNRTTQALAPVCPMILLDT